MTKTLEESVKDAGKLWSTSELIMWKEQHINAIASQEWLSHFDKVLYCESFSENDSEVKDHELASTFGPVELFTILDGVITVSELRDAIEALKNSKAAGPDGLSSECFR